MNSTHDPIAVLRFALRCGDWPLTRLLISLLSRDRNLRERIDYELAHAERISPLAASPLLTRLSDRLGLA